MEPVEIIIQTYQQIKNTVNEKLTRQGYQPIHEQHDDQLFHSRYMIWSNNAEALRLTWDGKEQWFVLEITEDLPLKALSTWSTIIIVPLDAKNKKPVYLEGIVHTIVNSLE
ncbi:hypothetical protein [Mucilaginibacter jinjuensis]|uniref:XisI protein n=1 Tax=Mucilaginibacter jinjuensis TaxID=1176721 RepID=A0ABY7TAN3_9SPHI|nr:hypothetical protein [Mucilaginibacter jinjuensis]WCT12277.1 hypothetical protein PQO05_26495 [Mucilaginibacter jinjuensis]